MADTSEFVERDIGAAAYLHYSGFDLRGLSKVGNRYVFRFDDESGKARTVAEQFFRGTARADNARGLLDSFKQVSNDHGLHFCRHRNALHAIGDDLPRPRADAASA